MAEKVTEDKLAEILGRFETLDKWRRGGVLKQLIKPVQGLH
jgi:hypothetical protein